MSVPHTPRKHKQWNLCLLILEKDTALPHYSGRVTKLVQVQKKISVKESKWNYLLTYMDNNTRVAFVKLASMFGY